MESGVSSAGELGLVQQMLRHSFKLTVARIVQLSDLFLDIEFLAEQSA